MSEPRPCVVILSGPNGAGKSTAAPALLEGTLAVNEFVNAHVIAHDLSATDADSAAIAAGRVMLARLRELAGDRGSFAFETTLASRTFAARRNIADAVQGFLETAREHGTLKEILIEAATVRSWFLPPPQ